HGARARVDDLADVLGGAAGALLRPDRDAGGAHREGRDGHGRRGRRGGRPRRRRPDAVRLGRRRRRTARAGGRRSGRGALEAAAVASDAPFDPCDSEEVAACVRDLAGGLSPLVTRIHPADEMYRFELAAPRRTRETAAVWYFAAARGIFRAVSAVVEWR